MRSEKRFSILLLAAFLFAAVFSFSAYSQETESEDWYMDKQISRVAFKGLKHVKNSDLSGITASYIGRTVESCVYDLLDRLYALEIFDDIEPGAAHDNADGVILTFTVVEKPVISAIRFKGNKKLRNSPLREAISIKNGDIFVESRVLIDTRAIRDAYLEKGYTNVKVSYKKETTDDGVEVVFVINEGRTVSVTDIQFVGNTAFTSKKLRKQVKQKTAGIFGKGAFQESQLETDKQAVQKFYMDQGYLDFHVLDVTRDYTPNEKKDRDDMVITYYLYEGDKYTFDGLSFTGNKVFSTERLNSLVTIHPGTIFNQTKFQESLMAVSDLYYENGYTSNSFSPAENRDSEGKRVSYVLNITERDRSHVEKIIVKGNTKTKEYVITRELPIKTGDVFSKVKIGNGLRNLYNLQYFSAVVPSIEPGSEPNLMNIVVSVEEQMTNSVEFGLTFSGVTNPKDLPFSVFVKWKDSNLFGTGRTVSASTTLSSTTQSVGVGYGQDWIFDTPISWNESLSFTHTTTQALRLGWTQLGQVDYTNYYMEYDSYSFALDSSLARRWMPDFAILTLAGGLTDSLTSYIYDSKVYTPIDTTISNNANKWGLTNSIWAKWSMDGRDVNYDPTKGWFFSEQLSWYGLLPIETDFFFKTDTKLEGYVPIVNIPFSDKYNFKIILAGYSGFTFQIPAPGSGVSDINKLYIDGMFNARGWTKIYNTVRGKAMWSNRLELRMPVLPGMIAIDGFLDFAVIEKEPEDMFQNLKAQDWYCSIGPDIRFLLPQFPMKLCFANCFRFSDESLVWYNTWQFVLSFNLVNK